MSGHDDLSRHDLKSTSDPNWARFGAQIPSREQLKLLSEQGNEATRYEYLKDIGQDLVCHWPSGLANLYIGSLLIAFLRRHAGI